jgi:transposase-like protein
MKKKKGHEDPEGSFDFKDFEKEALNKLRAGKGLIGPGGALTGLIQHLMETGLDEEMNLHLESDRHNGNRRNGHTNKTLKTGLGPIEISPPRDRDGTFEPELVPKWGRTITPELEVQILELYSIGNSYRDISVHLQKMYGVRYSEAQISTITDRIWEDVLKWQNRALKALYAFVFLDAIHFKIREDGHVKTRAIYTVLGVDLEGNRDVLGLYVGNAEGANTWGRILHDIKDRGVEDVLIFCVDGLPGFSEVIEEVFPISMVQRCIVHMIRTSLRFVSYKDYKAICKDLRKVYASGSLEEAEHALQVLGATWDAKYPEIREKWERHWLELSTFFAFPAAIRRVIYTTNAVESLHRHMRKVTKSKGAFVSEKALLKQLFLTLERNRSSWARKVFSWPAIARVLNREFNDRIAKHGDL